MGRGGLNGVCVAAGLKPKHVAREAPHLRRPQGGTTRRGEGHSRRQPKAKSHRSVRPPWGHFKLLTLVQSLNRSTVITANEYTPCLCVSCPFHTSPPYTTTNLIDTLALTGGNTHIGDIYILVHLV